LLKHKINNQQYFAMIGKRCKSGCKLVLFTNGESHTGFRLVSWKSLALWTRCSAIAERPRCRVRY